MAHAARLLLLALPVLALPALAGGADGPQTAPAPSPPGAQVWTDYPPSAAAAEPAADPAVVTPATVRLAIMSAARQDRGLWDDFDLDHDGTVSQLEVVACVAKRPRWLRTHFPELFAAIDTDHDGDISFAELQAFASRVDPPLFTISQRQPSLVGPDPTGAFGAGGAAAGAGVEIGSGGTTASAAFMHQQAYIAGYDVVGGQYQPVIGVLGYGTVLNVGNVVITIVHQGP